MRVYGAGSYHIIPKAIFYVRKGDCKPKDQSLQDCRAKADGLFVAG